MCALTKLIDKDQYELIGLTRNSVLYLSEKIKIIKGDITRPETFKQEIEGCYMILHAAAVTHSFNPKKYGVVNFESTKELITLAKHYKVTRFVYLSSHTAGLENGEYAKSKYLAENFLKKNFEKWTIIRPAELFGTNKNIGIEKLINSAINDTIHLCPIQVPIKLQPVHLQEAALLMHNFIFESGCSIKTSAIINGIRVYSYKEILDTCIKLKGERRDVIIPIPANIMALLEKIASFLPFYIGVIPDQVKRLYRQPTNFDNSLHLTGRRSIETYLTIKIKKT